MEMESAVRRIYVRVGNRRTREGELSSVRKNEGWFLELERATIKAQVDQMPQYCTVSRHQKSSLSGMLVPSELYVLYQQPVHRTHRERTSQNLAYTYLVNAGTSAEFQARL
jgi:hypothetical protein